MAIHIRWQPQACIERHFHDKKDFLTGHVIDVMLQPPHSQPIYLCGVYMPADLEQREQIYEYLALSKQHPHCILGGDWNANPIRNSSAQDRQHVRFLADMQAAACNPIPMTGATHYPGAVDKLPSRIDAFMTSTTCKALKSHAEPLQSTRQY